LFLQTVTTLVAFVTSKLYVTNIAPTTIYFRRLHMGKRN